MIRILVQIARILVGVTFVFSGFVKLIDPLGSAYKFEEYFSEGVLNLEFLIPYALIFSILLIVIELMLGIMILIGWRPRFTSYSLLGISVVFLFLTWYSAYYDKVTDCGCFGDAITLSPWDTFYKNIVLTALVVFILIKNFEISSLFGPITMRWIPFLSLMGALYVTYYVLIHLPLIDFRPYAVGKDLAVGMETFKEDGVPEVHDFSLESIDDDLTYELLEEEKVMLWITYDLNIADDNGFIAAKILAEKALKQGYRVYGVTASSDALIEQTSKRFNLPFEFLFCDATTLKTMIRSNPGLLILNKGIVVAKASWVDAQDIEL
jgi:uncharacterized membrane protein YphA (DoxX/SURF4 family)